MRGIVFETMERTWYKAERFVRRTNCEIIRHDFQFAKFNGDSRYVRLELLPKNRFIVQQPPPAMGQSAPTTPSSQVEIDRIHALVLDLASPDKREQVR